VSTARHREPGAAGERRAGRRAIRRGHRRIVVVRLCLSLVVVTAACAVPAPAPAPTWDAAMQASRSFGWRLEPGAWEACTVVVRARRELSDADADELDAVLTDWYNLARLSAFREDPRESGPTAAEAMGDPWLAAPDTLAATFHLGQMPRSGLVVLLNALEGFAAELTPLAEVVLCAERPPPAEQPRRGTT